jgi:hypothetical protein
MFQSNPTGRDVFTQISRPDHVTTLSQFREQLSWNKMDLPPVRNLHKPPSKESMLSVLACVRIAFHAVTSDQPNAMPPLFAEFMLRFVSYAQHLTFAVIHWSHP